MTDKEKLEEILKLCKLSNADLRLHMGEMTSDEILTVRALLNWILRILEK